MSALLSIRLNPAVKRQLRTLALRSKRSESFVAAQAIAAYVEAENWQLQEIDRGLKDLDRGAAVDHGKVSKWLRSWGRPGERKAPR